jgi:hypothetical protein
MVSGGGVLWLPDRACQASGRPLIRAGRPWNRELWLFPPMRQIVTKIVTSSARPKVDISEHFPGVIGAMRTGCYRGWKPLLRDQGKVGAASSRDCS